MGSKRVKIPKLSTEGKMPVTKLDVGIHQLETAIRLWFFDGDPVSICTLIYAANDVLRSLFVHGRHGPLPFDEELYVRPERLEEYRAIMRLDQNFCKHGGKDPDQIHHIAVKSYPIKIIEGIMLHNKMGFGKRPLFEVFSTWLWFSRPEFFFKKPGEFDPNIAGNVETIVRAGKQQFFNDFLPLIEQQLSGTSGVHGFRPKRG